MEARNSGKPPRPPCHSRPRPTLQRWKGTIPGIASTDLGPFLLKPWYWARVAPPRALQFAERPSPVVAAIHCGLSHQARPSPAETSPSPCAPAHPRITPGRYAAPSTIPPPPPSQHPSPIPAFSTLLKTPLCLGFPRAPASSASADTTTRFEALADEDLRRATETCPALQLGVDTRGDGCSISPPSSTWTCPALA
jgi:hypothetical protein